MCGIYGFSKLGANCQLSNDTIRYIVNTLAIGNESRGRDSVGIGIIDNDAKPFVFKKIGEVDKFLETPAIQDKLGTRINNETRSIFGHTRQATTGAVNLVNAQPFVYQYILGTHNGIVNNYKDISDKWKLKLQTTCDSEVIFGLLYQSDTLSGQAKLLSNLNGYFSIAWYNLKTPNKIYFAKDYNVLSIYKGKDFVLWSSESEPIENVKRIFGLELEELNIEDWQAISIDWQGKIERETIPVPIERLKAYTSKWNDEIDEKSLPCDHCYKRKGVYNYSYGSIMCRKCLKKAHKHPERFVAYNDMDEEFNRYMRRGGRSD